MLLNAASFPARQCSPPSTSLTSSSLLLLPVMAVSYFWVVVVSHVDRFTFKPFTALLLSTWVCRRDRPLLFRPLFSSACRSAVVSLVKPTGAWLHSQLCKAAASARPQAPVCTRALRCRNSLPDSTLGAASLPASGVSPRGAEWADNAGLLSARVAVVGSSSRERPSWSETKPCPDDPIF